MTTLATRTIALIAAGTLLASCGGSDDGNGNGSSPIDDIQDSISDATGLGDEEPPQAAPEELLLRDVEIAGYTFGSDTEDVAELRDAISDNLELDFVYEPAECDPAANPAYMEYLQPETTAIRMANTEDSSAELSVSTHTSIAEGLDDHLERCGDMSIRSDLVGAGEIVTETRSETFDADTPSGVSHVVAYTEHSTSTTPPLGEGSAESTTQVAETATISGVVRERAVHVYVGAMGETTTADELKAAAQEIFAAQVEKITDAE